VKYCIFQKPDGSEFAAFCLPPQTHTELAAAWRRNESTRVVSAGHVRLHADGHVETFGESLGLGLKPRDTDAKFIAAFYRATTCDSRLPIFRP
jgi:hypothetical protein